jgi:hypothetical protein
MKTVSAADSSGNAVSLTNLDPPAQADFGNDTLAGAIGCVAYNTATSQYEATGIALVNGTICTTTFVPATIVMYSASTYTQTPTPTPTPTPTTTPDTSTPTSTVSQSVTFQQLTSAPAGDEASAYNLGYRNAIGTGPSACSLCSCSFSSSRRSATLGFSATTTDALRSTALTNANNLVTTPANLATAINTAATSLGVTLSVALNGAQINALEASVTTISASSDDDNTALIAAACAIGGTLLLISAAYLWKHYGMVDVDVKDVPTEKAEKQIDIKVELPAVAAEAIPIGYEEVDASLVELEPESEDGAVGDTEPVTEAAPVTEADATSGSAAKECV